MQGMQSKLSRGVLLGERAGVEEERTPIPLSIVNPQKKSWLLNYKQPHRKLWVT